MLAADSLVARVAQTVEQHGSREAICDHEQRISYHELWRRSEAFARALLGMGLEPGARVALLMPSSADFVVACYGTWLARGVVVALNHASTATEARTWIDHAGASALVCETRHGLFAQLAPDAAVPPRLVLTWLADGAHAPRVHEWAGLIRAETQSVAPLEAAAEPASLACILYTSGTTGRPKGVMLSHGGLAANVASIVEYLSLTANDSVLTPMPFNYSYGSSVLHTHLAVGARVLIESNFVYPHKVVERMVTERITGFSGVPSTYALLLSRVDLAAHDLSALRYVTQAGGPMPVPLVARLTTALPRTRVFIMYGQTEATARLSYLPSERLQDKLGSIGKAIPGVTIEVRDESGQTVSNGVRGELWARGPNLMLGYWRDAEASARVLCQGWLKTGDMGYRDEDGFFWLVGRRSDIIKTGAHRVHPTEIEEVATACRGVQECAVVGVDDEMLGQVIKLYVVLQPNAQADAMSLKAHCRDRLAPHKVPRFVEIVAELPKTASGKVQRHRLTSA